MLIKNWAEYLSRHFSKKQNKKHADGLQANEKKNGHHQELSRKFKSKPQ